MNPSCAGEPVSAALCAEPNMLANEVPAPDRGNSSEPGDAAWRETMSGEDDPVPDDDSIGYVERWTGSAGPTATPGLGCPTRGAYEAAERPAGCDVVSNGDHSGWDGSRWTESGLDELGGQDSECHDSVATAGPTGSANVGDGSVSAKSRACVGSVDGPGSLDAAGSVSSPCSDGPTAASSWPAGATANR